MVLPGAKLVTAIPMHVLARRRLPTTGGRCQQVANGRLDVSASNIMIHNEPRLTFIPKVQAVRTNFSPAVVTSASTMVHAVLVLGDEWNPFKLPRKH